MRVSILLGSPSNMEKMKGACDALKEFGISYDFKVLSAHRSPELAVEYVRNAPKEGTQVFICGAGMAAHLAGVVAGHTTLPVIGVPLSDSALNGQDSLLSTVQMPKGVPVATVAIDGSYNAGVLAAQILAVGNEQLVAKIQKYKEKLEAKIKEANKNLSI